MKLLTILSLSLFACTDPSTRSLDEGKSDSGPSAHRRAVDACTDKFDGDAFDAYIDCIVAANNDAAADIDELVERELDIAGPLAAAFTAGERYCQLMQALENPDDPAVAALHRQNCRMNRNLDVALLMDITVAFEGLPPSFEPPGSRYPECYEAFDEAIADASSTNAMIEVNEGLASCVEAETRRRLEDSIVEGLQDGTTTADEARSRFDAELDGVVANIHHLCDVFAAAGGNEGGSLEKLQRSSCLADGIGMLGLESARQLETDL